MNQGLQGADNLLPQEFYRVVLSWVKDGNNILNLGCGLNFNFEKTISRKRRVNFALPGKDIIR